MLSAPQSHRDSSPRLGEQTTQMRTWYKHCNNIKKYVQIVAYTREAVAKRLRDQMKILLVFGLFLLPGTAPLDYSSHFPQPRR